MKHLYKFVQRRLLFCTLLLCALKSSAAVETFPSGSYIINMGIVPQTVNNGLKPYGLIYELLKTHKIPVKWVINQAKGKDGIDFTYNGVDYKGGTFIIPGQYVTPAIQSRITSYGVTGTTAGASFAADVTYTLSSAPVWTLNAENDGIAEKFFSEAGLPSTAYNHKLPAALGACDDIFVMPHSDPAWSTHGNLYDWVKNNHGSVWAGCRSVSIMENLFNPSNTSQQLNFLANNVGAAGNALIPYGDHDDPRTPFVHQHFGSPAAQYMGITDDAHTGGSEQTYLPVAGGSWRSTTQLIAYAPDQKQVLNGISPGQAAIIAFGHAYGDSNLGYVMYEGGHDISGKSTASIAAQRAFFNFSLLAALEKTPVLQSSGIQKNGNAYSVHVAASSPAGSALQYKWSSSCGGVFADPNSAATTFTPAEGSTDCVLTCVVTDACGRESFASIPFKVANYSISGRISNDADGGFVNGSGTNAGGSLYVSLIKDNVIVATTAVKSDGTYTFTDLADGNYQLVLNTTPAGSTSAQLPAGWQNTGEGTGPVTVDGITPDGSIDGSVSVNISSGSPLAITNVNFGVQHPPLAQEQTYTINGARPKPGDSVVLNGTGTGTPGNNSSPGPLRGSDPEDQPVTGSLQGRSVVITALPDNGVLFYGNEPVVLSGGRYLIGNYDPSLLKIQLTSGTYTAMTFEYAFVDRAGVQSPSVAYTINLGDPMPVTLVGFNAARNDARQALLRWETTFESNSDFFEIQHSVTGKDWRVVGTVKSHGTSEVLRKYDFLHQEVSDGTNYYRLRMVDFDGSFAFSKILALEFKTEMKISVYPNPVSDRLHIAVDRPEAISRIRIYTSAGQLVKELTLLPEKGIDVASLANGIYILKAHYEGGESVAEKILISR
ncbi:hypothetical protein J2Y45_006154 [Dyadobacter sp. BE34]|uniref:GOLD domain-containing protein n=1 Tax=Dyadobacter fermentans TaxID=94254 RepID=A0ABU1R7M2_9BACT|nr:MULTISPECIES: T9SS type A sorting domain-containing protein [Dyadobacter]MDR6808940.1 hypothetical protein [Dyadobacter fermentans]MDR7046683.1 hypothetical protein [Dyadobacter sp. BE242]MDR7200997.1 hypothetical protein [Dyadobacter sp. BE34]MDR7218957.1 hypothetical protein [Dyadobacter sp. BE31]MDR7264833.1 hypothetical protein [Dyadobacter sp. BE32]